MSINLDWKFATGTKYVLCGIYFYFYANRVPAFYKPGVKLNIYVSKPEVKLTFYFLIMVMVVTC
jgi:hypothetical protein